MKYIALCSVTSWQATKKKMTYPFTNAARVLEYPPMALETVQETRLDTHPTPITETEVNTLMESIHHNHSSLFYNEFQPIWEINEKSLFTWSPQHIHHFEALARVKGRPGGIDPRILDEAAKRKLTHKLQYDFTLPALMSSRAYGFRPSINIFPRELKRKDLASDFEYLLDRASMKPWEIAIEISEKNTADNVHRAIEKLKRLRRIGVQIFLDDANYDKQRLRSILDAFNANGERIDAVKIDMDPVLNLDEPDREIDAIAYSEIRQVMNTVEGRSRMIICEGLNPPICKAENAKQEHLLEMCPKDLELAGQGGMSVDGKTARRILQGNNHANAHPIHLANCEECRGKLTTVLQIAQ